MQTIFILGIFGVLYTSVAVLISMVATSSMQLKVERIKEVEAFFQDVEIAVNKGFLSENVDFVSVGFQTTFPTAPGSDQTERLDNSIAEASKRFDKLLAPYMSWAPEKILKDPWGTDYYFARALDDAVIYADNKGNEVTAPISVFLLVSAGPDKAFADYADKTSTAVFPKNYDDIKRLVMPETDASADNIVHVFSTMEPMADSWNYAKNLHGRVLSVFTDNYKSQYELFSPTLQAEYYNKVDGSGNKVLNFFVGGAWIGDSVAPSKDPSDPCLSTYMNAWKDPRCNVPNIGNGFGNLTEVTGFPVFETGVENIGMLSEVQAGLEKLSFVMPNINVTVSDSDYGLQDKITVSFTQGTQTNWTVVYSEELDGNRIIGGF